MTHLETEPTGGARPGNHVTIDGVSIKLDDIVNKAFFAPGRVQALRETFLKAEPFPHIVLDDLFWHPLLELMHADFDRLDWRDWRRYDSSDQIKRGTAPKTRFGDASQLFFNTIHSGEFVHFIEKISGIEGLLPDPTLSAGGLHEIPMGGKFSMHIDFNHHLVTKLDNRLAFITYLNKDWIPSYGGSLELWSLDENKSIIEISPIFGRSVLFYQSSKSLHGHPKPVDVPDGRKRRSAAAYYYSNGRSDSEEATHHSTLYPNSANPAVNEKLSNAIKYLLPPILVDGARKIKSLLR